VETWSGSGSVYSPAGDALSTYQIQVTVTPSDDSSNTSVSVAKITEQDGTNLTITETITPSGNSFQVASNIGNGGGSCYGNAFCEVYIAGQNGLAYATTVAIDGADSRRDLTFELQNGQAVRVLRDQMKRMN
jgi:hypothetical protein